MHNLDKIDKNHISPDDKFLDDLRKKLPETASQQAERLKHEKIAKMRDQATEQKKPDHFWEAF